MKIVILGEEKKTDKNVQPEPLEPNITESCIFRDEQGNDLGFYLTSKDVPDFLKKVATLANNELLSERVPKTIMSRVYIGEDGNSNRIEQFSTIIGAVKPELIKRRYIPGLSHVHMHRPAEKYIKFMYKFASECEKLIQELTPSLYEKQLSLLSSQKIKIGNLWTSSIANFNTAARTHTDGANIQGANNIIYYKRKDSKGGHLHVPGYDAIVDSHNDSLLFYPAYKNMHGVSEIIPLAPGGYRNSLVLYPLDIDYGNNI